MSWISDLYETYELCYEQNLPGETQLMPICHTKQNAHIEVTIDAEGQFRRAEVIKEGNATLVPCTEKSGSRAGSKPVSHPLCDKLQYLAGDFLSFGGEVTSGFAKDPSKPFEDYVDRLSQWAGSEFSHPKVNSVLTYVLKKSIVSDLVASDVIPVDQSTAHQLKEWTDEKDDAPSIFRALPKGYEPLDAFVRWRVEVDGELESSTWRDNGLIQSWVNFYSASLAEKSVCFVEGEATTVADMHPAKIRHAGDKAKLVSGNDGSGFTYRGRFLESDQPVQIGFDVSQKAHNALRWLIERQGYRNGDLVYVAWSPRGTELPDAFGNTFDFFGDDISEDSQQAQATADVAQHFAIQLRKMLSGYKANLDPTESVVIVGVDSATPGRLSVVMHRRILGSELLQRIESWHSDFAWHQNYSKKLKFTGAPSPGDIAEAAYGQRLDEKLKQSTIQRLVPCIIDGAPFPRDIVAAAVNRMTQRMGMEQWEWNKCLGITCSIFRGSSNQHNKGYQMALETNNTSRDYLYGRLLAIADHIENRALYLSGESRDTNAARNLQRFADFPYSTWKTIELAISPYRAQLKSKRGGLLKRLEEELDEVMAKFSSESFKVDQRLSGEFLLAFHCQRKELWQASEIDSKTETSN